uniref:Sesquiterpene synthase n=1 Tax=Azadirachta indica var. indica TaxID=531399 RepID=T2C602_AZAIN|nr:sesquiterpene synthase [Azadirachta indica var. indica]
MSRQLSASPVADHNAEPDSNRRSASYHPSIWGDHFLSYASNDSMETTDIIDAEHQELKEEIGRMLMGDINKPSQKKPDFIDSIQRLGVSYHFENEIDGILGKIYNTDHHACDDENIDDLYYISLHFRLLRQHGYKITADVFNKFKDSDGNFKDSLVGDLRGMLSLYEVTHLKVHGENILDEAFAFVTKYFKLTTTQFNSPLVAQIKHALKRPIHKSLQRLEARYYMSIYQEDPPHDKVLLTFAKLDFNKLQKLHQKELSGITRDRVVECYFWTLEVYFEPKYSLARRIVTKVIAMTSVIDDIYDVYGTIEGLEFFTVAIERWDISVVDQLPEYMKLCYQVLLDVYSEIEKDLVYQRKLYRLYHAKEAMKTVVKNYFLETKWCHKKYVPKMNEYMIVALVTSAYSMLATTSFVGMGDIVTKEAFEWLFSNPKMIIASSVVCRLMDDIVSHKFEQKRGHVASSIECFMKEHGASEEEACNEFQKKITNAWKDINEECLRPTSVPMPLLLRILNLTRVIDVIYKDEDGYTHAGVVLKGYVASFLIDPVPV